MSATTERKRYPEWHWSQWPVSDEAVDAHLRLASDVYRRTRFDIFRRLVGRDLRGKTVLDYGGGAGLLAVRCAEQGARVTLLDPEPNSLGITRLRCCKPGSLRRRVSQAGYRPTRGWGMFIVPYNIRSWLVLLRRSRQWSGLHRRDLALGAVFPFNRLGWSLIVLAERAGA